MAGRHHDLYKEEGKLVKGVAENKKMMITWQINLIAVSIVN
jgi:hypothetical protein